jgi:hypothetical protein
MEWVWCGWRVGRERGLFLPARCRIVHADKEDGAPSLSPSLLSSLGFRNPAVESDEDSAAGFFFMLSGSERIVPVTFPQ